jgi:hypothetical protein
MNLGEEFRGAATGRIEFDPSSSIPIVAFEKRAALGGAKPMARSDAPTGPSFLRREFSPAYLANI